jgi:hypothetical protein
MLKLMASLGLILFLFFSVALPSFGSEHLPASSGRIFVVLRFDDVGVNTKLEQLTPVLSAMDAVGAPYTLGVIPAGISNSPQIVTLLKRLAHRGIDLAEHGFTHEECAGRGSEFRGPPVHFKGTESKEECEFSKRLWECAPRRSFHHGIVTIPPPSKSPNH